MTSFFCISDRESATTRELLRAACLGRNITFETVRAATFDFSLPTPTTPGDLIYCAATSARATRIEGHLRTRGVVALEIAGAHRTQGATQNELMARQGVPVVASLPFHGRDRGTIGRAVEALGGFPIVVKVPGGEGGVGVILVESRRSLVSLLDYLDATGRSPELSAFVPEASHWRVIVLGGRIVAGYINQPIDGDFRTYASDDPADHECAPPPRVVLAAQAAAQALGLEFAGVDVLVDRAGNPYVVEANSPCYFAPAQLVGGVDVAGAIVDHLLAKGGVSR